MLILPVWLFLFTTVLGESLISSTLPDCARSCFTAVSALKFSGKVNKVRGAPCANILQAQSTYLCASEYCSTSEVDAGLEYFQEACLGYGLKGFPYSVVSNITTDTESTYPVLSSKNLKGKTNYTTPVLLSQDAFTLAHKTVADRTWVSNTHVHYGWAMLGFWGLVVLVGVGNRIHNFIGEHRNYAQSVDLEGSSPSGKRGPILAIKSWVRRRLTVPAAFIDHCRQPIGMCTVPPRLEILTIASFVIINFVLCCVGYKVFNGNLTWSAVHTQLARYISERCGVLAVSNMPVLWLFAQRNNFLMFLTGWSFSTFNTFHRWIARVVALEAIIHAIVMSVYEVQNNNYKTAWPERFWQMGVLAVVVMSLLPVLALYKIRRKAYELFLICHICLAIVLIYAVYMHLELVSPYRVYIWTCIAVWSFDRFLRLSRLLILQANSRSMQAASTYDADADAVRLSIASSKLIKPRPGQYYFIYLVEGWKFWESHPFTISSWTSANVPIQVTQGKKVKFHANMDPEKKEIGVEDPDSSAATSSSTSPMASYVSLPVSSKDESLNFIIRPYDSFTARLKHAATAKTRLRVAVEGPYGTPLELSSYGGLLFVVGGTGITVPMSYLTHLRQKSTPAQNIHIIWAIRQQALLDFALNDGLRDYLEFFGSNLTLSVYVTSQNAKRSPSQDSEMPSSTSSSSNSVVNIEKTLGTNQPDSSSDTLNNQANRTLQSIALHQSITLHTARPDVPSLVTSYVTSSPSSYTSKKSSRICVVTCGPAAMSDATRRAVVQALGSSELKAAGVDLTFKDEGFGW